jgi:hypothetical protein
MIAKKFILGIAGVAALAVPFAASAQQYYGQPSYGGQPYYGQPQGDYYNRGWGWGWGHRFPGYPEFRGPEEHIRREIREAVRDDMIAPDDARDLFGQLRQIQWHEQRVFERFGWNAPDEARGRIRFELGQLDRQVDQIRQEP